MNAISIRPIPRPERTRYLNRAARSEHWPYRDTAKPDVCYATASSGERPGHTRDTLPRHLLRPASSTEHGETLSNGSPVMTHPADSFVWNMQRRLPTADKPAYAAKKQKDRHGDHPSTEMRDTFVSFPLKHCAARPDVRFCLASILHLTHVSSHLAPETLRSVRVQVMRRPPIFNSSKQCGKRGSVSI